MQKTLGTLSGVERGIVSSGVVTKNHFFSDFLSTWLLDCSYNLPPALKKVAQIQPGQR